MNLKRRALTSDQLATAKDSQQPQNPSPPSGSRQNHFNSPPNPGQPIRTPAPLQRMPGHPAPSGRFAPPSQSAQSSHSSGRFAQTTYPDQPQRPYSQQHGFSDSPAGYPEQQDDSPPSPLYSEQISQHAVQTPSSRQQSAPYQQHQQPILNQPAETPVQAPAIRTTTNLPTIQPNPSPAASSAQQSVPYTSTPYASAAYSSAASNLPSVVKPQGEPDPLEQKLENYQTSRLFDLLLSGNRPQEVLQLLAANLQKAQAAGDSLYTEIFKGGIAASQSPPKISEAVKCYQQAFDQLERMRKKPDGFLYSMVWNLFAELSHHPEVSRLLDRARSAMNAVQSFYAANMEQVQSLFGQLRQAIPGFSETIREVQESLAQEKNLFQRKILRESRLAKQRLMLLFPREGYRISESDRTFSGRLSHPVVGNYFVWNKGFGTIFDPSADFLNEFYRIGGSPVEIRNIVLTGVSMLNQSFFSSFRTLLERLKQGNVMQPIRIILPSDFVDSLDTIFQELRQLGVVEQVVPMKRSTTSELLGGGRVTLRTGSMLLQLEGGQTVQFTGQLDSALELDSEELTPFSDAMILPVASLDDLLWAAQQVKRCTPRLAVFDLLEPSRNLFRMAETIRQSLELGPGTATAYADSALACDLGGQRFLDCVKAFEGPACWTEYTKLSFGLAEQHELEGFYYFERGTDSRFWEEQKEIIEMFRSQQQSRRGLYFS